MGESLRFVTAASLFDGHDASIDETRDAVVLCVAKAGAVFGAGFRSLGLGVGVRVWV